MCTEYIIIYLSKRINLMCVYDNPLINIKEKQASNISIISQIFR